MKERTTKVGGFIEKAGLAKGSELKVSFPEKIAEIASFIGKKKFGKLEVDISEPKIIGMLWRGFTLAFQGGGEGSLLTPEAKEANKAKRKADNSAISALREKAKAEGKSLADYLRSLK
jgi:hypothetical protein